MNATFKFTFGSFLPKILSSTSGQKHADLSRLYQINEITNIKLEMDKFFSLLFKRLTKISLFDSFNDDCNKLKLTENKSANINSLHFIKRDELVCEMHDKLTKSIPFLELPHCLSYDLDIILANFESHESLDFESDCKIFRRLFLNNGSCLFYKVSNICL
jgi:hypothetical protein